MRRGHIDRNILFLCEDNSCLSQIAEAAAKHLAPPRTRIFSAGVKPSTIPAHVIQAMQELGISMSGQKSKGLAEVPIQDIDLVVSFGDAHKKCDNLPGRAKVETWRCRRSSSPNRRASRRYRRFGTSAMKLIKECLHCSLTIGVIPPSLARTNAAARL